MYPKFWQFYARGFLWAVMILFPIWWLNSILLAKSGIGKIIYEFLNKIFLFGWLIIGFICKLGKGCFTDHLSFKEVSFFAYFLSALALGFIIALYKSWSWTPKLNNKTDE